MKTFAYSLSLLALVIVNAFAGERDDRYLDRSIPAQLRLAEAREDLRKELREPTPPHRGGIGGMITHEYLLAQLIIRFERIVNYYDENERRWRNDEPGLAELSSMMKSEKSPSAREIMMITLAGCGDRSREGELIEIVQRDGDPTIRCYTIQALGNNGCQAAIPVLLKQLSDRYEISAGCLPIYNEGTVFPVREYSMRALRRLGVTVVYMKHGWYRVDVASVRRAMKPETGETKADVNSLPAVRSSNATP